MRKWTSDEIFAWHLSDMIDSNNLYRSIYCLNKSEKEQFYTKASAMIEGFHEMQRIQFSQSEAYKNVTIIDASGQQVATNVNVFVSKPNEIYTNALQSRLKYFNRRLKELNIKKAGT